MKKIKHVYFLLEIDYNKIPRDDKAKLYRTDIGPESKS